MISIYNDYKKFLKNNDDKNHKPENLETFDEFA